MGGWGDGDGVRLIQTVLVAVQAFNGDPHPGNILLCPDGRVGLIDYGQVACSCSCSCSWQGCFSFVRCQCHCLGQCRWSFLLLPLR